MRTNVNPHTRIFPNTSYAISYSTGIEGLAINDINNPTILVLVEEINQELGSLREQLAELRKEHDALRRMVVNHVIEWNDLA